MRTEVLDDADAVARRAAQFIAEQARAAVAARGIFAFAVSGGRTPWQMLQALATEQVPWSAVHLFQVDERVAPAGDPDRNFTHIAESLLARVPATLGGVHAMPVEETDLAAAAVSYGRDLSAIAGDPAILDLVHLGLGPDGHTASLVPGDAVLQISDVDVALTGVYQNRRRVTLTYPVLNRARCVLWLVTGAEKVAMLQRLLDADASIPAGRVRQDQGFVLADRAAAADQAPPNPAKP